MLLQNLSRAAIVFVFICLYLTTASAQSQTVTLNAVDSGWYSSTGFHDAARDNYLVGKVGSNEYHNFFVFDLSAVTGRITGATLRVSNPEFGYVSNDPSETYQLYDVSTPTTTLSASNSGRTDIFNDLSSGATYGSILIPNTADNTIIAVNLNATAVAALNNVRAPFAIGGALTTIDNPDDQYVFGGTGDATDTRQLVLTVEPTTPPPPPGTTYSISGRVTDGGGTGLSNVTVTLSGSQSATTQTDSSGNYSFGSLAAGGNYTITPSKTNYTFSPTNRTATNLSGNQTFNFTGTVVVYTISGRVVDNIGNGLSSVAVTLSGSSSGAVQTDSNGNYSFGNLTAGGNYTITPSKTNLTFNPSSQTFNNLSGNQTANFTSSIILYTISGRVTDPNGNGVSGVTQTLSGAQTGTTTTDSGGNFFLRNLPAGGSYTITPSKANYTFTPSSRTFNNLSGDQTANFIAPNTVQFSAPSYSISESVARITLAVTRSGDTSTAAFVDYSTVDNPAAVACNDFTTMPGVAFARCDYATAVDTLSFAPGETTKTFTIPIIDDVHVEGNETFQVRLSNAVGVTLGSQSLATVTILDDDTTTSAPNPIKTTPFFVRQQYIDFLSREPEPDGFNAWTGVLNRCPNVENDPSCDRIEVSASFFRSQEFQFKGYFVYLFYKVSLNRRPRYDEIIPDMRRVTGQTGEEVIAKKRAFTDAWVQRQTFKDTYDAMGNAAYVDALLRTYGVASITTPDPANPDGTALVTLTRNDLVSALDGQRLTRAQVLRAIVQSKEVDRVEYNGAFVAMQYYGYLRREPEQGGYDAWLRVINRGDSYRVMVDGFMNSDEYKQRFGPAR